MLFFFYILLTVAATGLAQRPQNTSVCDYYTPLIIGTGTSTPAKQKLLVTLLINTVVLGNYTTPNVGVKVDGFAAPNVYNNTKIDLLPFFTAEYNSTNLGGDNGVSKMFLDDGQAEPLKHNMSSNGNPHSAQTKVLENIYAYFGSLLGCSQQFAPVYPPYQGRTSMYEVHRFMNLDRFQMEFFISQVVLSARSLGISAADAEHFGNQLDESFNYRCAPKTKIAGLGQQEEFQSVCIASGCPLAKGSVCAEYPQNGVALEWVNITDVNVEGGSLNGTNNGTSNGTGNGTSSGAPVQASGFGSKDGKSVIVIGILVLGAFVLF